MSKFLELQYLRICPICLHGTDDAEGISLKTDFSSTRHKMIVMERQLNVPTRSFKDVEINHGLKKVDKTRKM